MRVASHPPHQPHLPHHLHHQPKHDHLPLLPGLLPAPPAPGQGRGPGRHQEEEATAEKGPVQVEPAVLRPDAGAEQGGGVLRRQEGEEGGIQHLQPVGVQILHLSVSTVGMLVLGYHVYL